MCYIVASLGVIVVSGKGAASAEMGDRSLPPNNAGESKVASHGLKMKQKLCTAAAADCCVQQQPTERKLVQLRCDRQPFLAFKAKSKGRNSSPMEGMTCFRCLCTLVAR